MTERRMRSSFRHPGESDLARSDAFAWALVNAAPDGVFVVEAGGVIVLANRRAEELLGYDRGELLGVTVEDLVPAPLRTAHHAHRDQYSTAPYARPMGDGRRLRARRRDGSQLVVEISLSPMYEGSARLVIATLRPRRESARRHLDAPGGTADGLRGQLDATVRRLEHLALTLASARNGPVEQLERGCDEALAQLDGLVHEIQALVFERRADLHPE